MGLAREPGADSPLPLLVWRPWASQHARCMQLFRSWELLLHAATPPRLVLSCLRTLQVATEVFSCW